MVLAGQFNNAVVALCLFTTIVQNGIVRINRVVYSLFDKSNFVVSRRGLSYLMICEV